MINGHSIPTYGPWIGAGLVVVGIVGLICVGVLIGWAGRDRAVERAFAAGEKAERDERERLAGHPAPAHRPPVVRHNPAPTKQIPRVQHPATDDDATQILDRWRQS